jgi:hypothetical protein
MGCLLDLASGWFIILGDTPPDALRLWQAVILNRDCWQHFVLDTRQPHLDGPCTLGGRGGITPVEPRGWQTIEESGHVLGT